MSTQFGHKWGSFSSSGHFDPVIEMVEQLAKKEGSNRLALHGKDGKLFYYSTWIALVDYTDDFYDDIYQDQDYEDKVQQDIDFGADDLLLSLDAGDHLPV